MLTISFGLMSCQSETPVAELEVSKTIVSVGEIIEFNNLSTNCDISVVNLGGEGTYNKRIRVGEDFEVDDRSFLFSYDRPGEYIVKVIAENTSFLTGTTYSVKEIKVLVNPVSAKN